MAPQSACMVINDKGVLEGHPPLKVMGTDMQRYNLNPDRLLFMRYVIGSSTMAIITPRGAIPMMICRLYEFFFTYADEAEGQNKLFSMPLKHLQPRLRLPPYYWKGEERIYVTKEIGVMKPAFGPDQQRMVQDLIQEVFSRWGNEPILVAEVAVMLPNRFDILLDEDFGQQIYLIKKESLEALEFQRIQIMRRKGENSAREARERQGNSDAEEFDVGTEASWNLDEEVDAPDGVPQMPDPKSKGKGTGRGAADYPLLLRHPRAEATTPGRVWDP